MNDRHSRPRWVTGFIVVAALVAIAFVVIHMTIGSPFDHRGGAVLAGLPTAIR
jgi:hypothetical protein